MTGLKLVCVLLLVILIFPACSPDAHADTAEFSLHKALDTNGDHHVAFTYLLPKGWKTADIITWDLKRRTAPMEFSLAAVSPGDSKFAVTYLNMAVFNYTRVPNKGDTGKAPPQQPTDMIIEAFKNSHPGVDVEVVERQETPVISKFKDSDVSKSRALTCAVKLRYVVNGVPMLTKSGFDFDGYDMGTAFGRSHGFLNGYWALANVTSISGPEAQFPGAMKLGAVVLSSRQWDPQFFQQYQEVCFMLIKQMQNEAQERLNAQFTAMRQNYHDLSHSNMEAFKAQMAAKDRHTRNFCDYVLDRERYSDGHTEFILPNGYSRAVTNGSAYILTNDPAYNAASNWHELKRVK